MDNYKIWIYVIIGAIYLISRIRKKPESKPTQRSESEPTRNFPEYNTPTPTTTRQLTFEELLQEITQGKQPAQPRPVLAPTTVVDYDEDLGEEEQDLEDVNYEYKRDDNRSNEVYESAKKQAFNRPSLEETMKVDDTNVKFAKFKVFEEEEKPKDLLSEYIRDLQDPEGFKKAVVLSEILNRRF